MPQGKFKLDEAKPLGKYSVSEAIPVTREETAMGPAGLLEPGPDSGKLERAALGAGRAVTGIAMAPYEIGKAAITPPQTEYERVLSMMQGAAPGLLVGKRMIVDPMVESAKMGVENIGQGNVVTGGLQTIASALPFLGPWVSSLLERGRKGDVAGAIAEAGTGALLGKGLGGVAGKLIPKAGVPEVTLAKAFKTKPRHQARKIEGALKTAIPDTAKAAGGKVTDIETFEAALNQAKKNVWNEYQAKLKKASEEPAPEFAPENMPETTLAPGMEAEIRPIIEDAGRSRMAAMEDLFSQGIGDLSGKGRPVDTSGYNAEAMANLTQRDTGYGRIPLKRMFPEIENFPENPKRIAEAIRKDENNPLYLRVKQAVEREVADTDEIRAQNEMISERKAMQGEPAPVASVPGQIPQNAIDGTSVAEAIRKSITRKVERESPSTVKAINNLADKYDGLPIGLEEAESIIKTANAEVNAYYSKNRVGRQVAREASPKIRARLAQLEALRTALYDKLDKLTGPGAADLKKRYGNLLEIENQLSKVREASTRSVPGQFSIAKGMWDIGRSALNVKPLDTLQGAYELLLGRQLERVKSPDYLIQKAFEQFERPTRVRDMIIRSVPDVLRATPAGQIIGSQPKRKKLTEGAGAK